MASLNESSEETTNLIMKTEKCSEVSSEGNPLSLPVRKSEMLVSEVSKKEVNFVIKEEPIDSEESWKDKIKHQLTSPTMNSEREEADALDYSVVNMKNEEDVKMEESDLPEKIIETCSSESEELACTSQIDGQSNVEYNMACCLQLASSTESLSVDVVGMSTEEKLSKNCFSSGQECQMTPAVASCSTAGWGYLSENNEEQIAGVRLTQHNNQSESERDGGGGVTSLERGKRKKSFNQVGSITTHMPRLGGERTFKCRHCEKSFHHNNSLSVHMRSHTGERPYKCSLCEKSFFQGGELTKHIRTHTGEKPFKCSHCVKSFSQKCTLTTHMRRHMGDKPYKCSQCKKSFHDRCHLIRHLRIHTGEKPYKCCQCEKSFNQSNNLTSHMRVHTGERPYRCAHCEKTFSKKYNLTTHMHTHKPTTSLVPLNM